MNRFFARVTAAGGDLYLIDPVSRTDPGFGGGLGGGVDPGYGHPTFPHPGHDLPGGGHPGHALPIPPVRPSPPITLPPGVWPPQLPPSVDNSLPPGTRPDQPIVIPPGVDNDLPIHLPTLPAGMAVLIALPPLATPKVGTPPGTVPAILVQSGKRPVLVYVSAAAQPK